MRISDWSSGRVLFRSDELFRQFVRQVLDRSIDELRPVIGGDDLDSIGKALLELLELGLDRRDRRARVSALSRSEEHTSELQSLMRISYAVICLKKKTITKQ